MQNQGDRSVVELCGNRNFLGSRELESSYCHASWV